MKARISRYCFPMSILCLLLICLLGCTSQPSTVKITDTSIQTLTTTLTVTKTNSSDTITQTLPISTTVTTTSTQTTTIPTTETVTVTTTQTSSSPSINLLPEDAPIVPHALLLGMGACFACHPIPPGHEGNAIVEDFCGTCHYEAPMSDWKTF